MRRLVFAVLFGVLIAPHLAMDALAQTEAGPYHDDERHAGYYYPEPQSHEIYIARATTMPQANRNIRIGFVTGLTNENLAKPYPPTVAIFAKGDEADKLIIISLEDDRIDTIYRARAIFANLTSVARTLPIFESAGVETYFTFFDLARMMGFRQITISDGRDFAHQVILQEPGAQ